MEYKMDQELTTAVKAIKTAILQSPNSSAASDELTSIIPIADFNLSRINFQDYDKPTGVTTYKSLSEMSENMQKVLPDLNDIKKIM